MEPRAHEPHVARGQAIEPPVTALLETPVAKAPAGQTVSGGFEATTIANVEKGVPPVIVPVMNGVKLALAAVKEFGVRPSAASLGRCDKNPGTVTESWKKKKKKKDSVSHVNHPT